MNIKIGLQNIKGIISKKYSELIDRKYVELIDRKYYWLLAIILILFFYFKFLYMNSLGIFLDEGVFIYRSWRMLEGDILYSQLGDIRTPGHYFYFFIPLMLIGKLINLSPVNTILFFRWVLAILEAATLYIIYRILNIVNNDNKTINILLIATVAISPFILGWSNYAITENIVLLPFFLSIFIFLKLSASKKLGYKTLMFLGFLIGISVLIRQFSIIFYIPMVLYIFLIFRKEIRSLIFFNIGIIISVIPIFIYLIANGAFFDFINGILGTLSKNPKVSIDFKYNQYIREPMILDPALSFIIIFSILSLYIYISRKRNISGEKKLLE